jgi:hypothetical protein
MNLSIMLWLHDLSHPASERGPHTPRPADPSPEGGEGEPVGDDDDDESERGSDARDEH